MKTVLVTGAGGQLAKCLKDIAYKYSDLDFVFKDSDELNITKKKDIFDLFKNTRFDYCINCAAYTDVEKAESELSKAKQVNTFGVKYLAEACLLNQTILVHISTDFVFDGKKQKPYSEDDITNPINNYGLSKVLGEIELSDILKRYYILRTSWLYSEYGKNFFKTIIRLSKEDKEIKVINDQYSRPTYAGDLAKVILDIVSSNSNYFGTYHYSNEGMASWFDFAKKIATIMKLDLSISAIKSKDFNSNVIRPTYSVLETKKINKTFRIQNPNWENSLIKVIAKMK